MSVTRLFATLAVAALTLIGKPVSAHESIYTGTFLGTSEIPANASAGTGQAIVTIDFDLFTMRVQASFSGLTGTVTASHIHCCAAPGTVNAGVATQTPSFTGFPTGVKSGDYDHTFDMTLASSYNAAYITANGGLDPQFQISNTFNALVAGLDAGNAYLNIHTSTFGGGEVRALLTLAPVPEPETYGMLLAGLALVGAVARRRKVAL